MVKLISTTTHSLEMSDLELNTLRSMLTAAQRLIYASNLNETNSEAIVSYQEARNSAWGQNILKALGLKEQSA